MKAKQTDRTPKFTGSHRRDKGFTDEYVVVATRMGEGVSFPVTLRLYQPRRSNVYACLWTTGEKYASGSGVASGGGYHKGSAAAAEAIRNAGFDLDEDIAGRGDAAIREALKAVAVAVIGQGFTEMVVYNVHS